MRPEPITRPVKLTMGECIGKASTGLNIRGVTLRYLLEIVTCMGKDGGELTVDSIGRGSLEPEWCSSADHHC